MRPAMVTSCVRQVFLDGHQLPDAAATEATESGCRGVGRVCRSRWLGQEAFGHGTGLWSQTAGWLVDSRDSAAGGDPPHIASSKVVGVGTSGHQECDKCTGQ